MRLGKGWGAAAGGNKRKAKRCCPHCAARLQDIRQVGDRKPIWNCPMHGMIKRGTYASGLEADRAIQLRTLQDRGIISELQEQRIFEVQPEGCELITWRVDFTYIEDGRRIAEDAKGMEDAEYRIKAKLFRWKYAGQIELSISRRGRRGNIFVERAA